MIFENFNHLSNNFFGSQSPVENQLAEWSLFSINQRNRVD